ncbi:MAG: hypothetical protein R3236_02505 [Phycisphaeraceae bacterium]|nr:hypothetical protein [Phycisphaeraceae bacterium]
MNRHAIGNILICFGLLLGSGCEDYDQQRRDRQHRQLNQRLDREKRFDEAFAEARAYLASAEAVDQEKLDQLIRPFSAEPEEAVAYLTQSTRSLEGNSDTAGSALLIAARLIQNHTFDRSSRLSNIPGKTKNRVRLGFNIQEVSRQILMYLSRTPGPPAKWRQRLEQAQADLSDKKI